MDKDHLSLILTKKVKIYYYSQNTSTLQIKWITTNAGYELSELNVRLNGNYEIICMHGMDEIGKHSLVWSLQLFSCAF